MDACSKADPAAKSDFRFAGVLKGGNTRLLTNVPRRSVYEVFLECTWNTKGHRLGI